MRRNTKDYVGIDKDVAGAMNTTGNIIRDAWVFGLIPESETCGGWSQRRIEDLYQRVSASWEQYGSIPSRLPPELRERHQRIYAAAIENARKQGWDPDQALENEI